jgi:hypothetical protein
VTADPDEPDGAADGALGGRLLVWYGSARGIDWEAEPVQLTQNTPGVPGRVRRATDSAVPSPWPT